MADQIRDISNNQGRGGLAVITDPGTQGVYAKATESLSFTDDWYHVYREAASKARKPFGGYMFLHPERDGAAQARYFLTWAKPQPGDLQPVVDSEVLGASGWRGAAAATLTALKELEAHGYRPLLYGSTSFLRMLLANEPTLARYRVWQAEYGPVLHRIPGFNPVMWQFTDKAVIAKGELRVDSDRILVRNLDSLRIPKGHVVTHPVVKKPRAPRIRYYTYKKDVPRKPGYTVRFREGRGFYTSPVPKPASGGSGRPSEAA